PTAPWSPPAAATARRPAPSPPPPSPSVPPKLAQPPQPAAPVEPTGGSFIDRFSGVEEFLEVYRRDILQGGLFVSTRYPRRLQETGSVELFPPGQISAAVVA